MPLCQAGMINGNLKENGRSVGKGINIIIICRRDHKPLSYGGETDKYGGYSIFVKNTGQCKVSVQKYSGAETNIYSYVDPVRFDMNITKDGTKYRLYGN